MAIHVAISGERRHWVPASTISHAQVGIWVEPSWIAAEMKDPDWHITSIVSVCTDDDGLFVLKPCLRSKNIPPPHIERLTNERDSF
jgi:hypothetical protein